MVTKKLKDITINEAISICSKMAYCNGHDHNCQLYVDSFRGCIFRNIYMMPQSGNWNEYYNEHKNDLITFEYDDGNTNTNDGGISW